MRKTGRISSLPASSSVSLRLARSGQASGLSQPGSCGPGNPEGRQDVGKPEAYPTPTGRRLLLLFGLALLLALGACAGAEFAGKAAPEWDALFQRQSGWIGADGNYSIPLSRDTTLWLFSDTFVGRVKDGKRLDARMINNSVALQRGTNAPEFFYGTTTNGQPASFIEPEHGSPRGYFWLAHGIRTSRGLWFFMQRIVTVRSGTPFGFKLVDTWLAQVANPHAPPPQWRITQIQVPCTEVMEKGALTFGGAVLQQGEYAYIFGGDSRPEAGKAEMPNGLVLARVPAERIADFAQWRFLANGVWQEDFRKVTPAFRNLGSEFSVSWLPGRKEYAVVYSEGIWGKILVRLAPALTGPWSSPKEVFRCPEMDWPTKAFCYAAKAHPELATAPDELLITYAANAWDFWDLFKDARLYWPRFVRVNLDAK